MPEHSKKKQRKCHEESSRTCRETYIGMGGTGFTLRQAGTVE